MLVAYPIFSNMMLTQGGFKIICNKMIIRDFFLKHYNNLLLTREVLKRTSLQFCLKFFNNLLLTQGGVWRRSQTGLQADSHLDELQGCHQS